MAWRRPSAAVERALPVVPHPRPEPLPSPLVANVESRASASDDIPLPRPIVSAREAAERNLQPGISFLDVNAGPGIDDRERGAILAAWDTTVLSNDRYGTGGDSFECKVCSEQVMPTHNFGRWQCWRKVYDLSYPEGTNDYYVRADHLSPFAMTIGFYETALSVDAEALKRVTIIAPNTAPIPEAVANPPASTSAVGRVTASRMSVMRCDASTNSKARLIRETFTKRRGVNREALFINSLRGVYDIRVEDLRPVVEKGSVYISRKPQGVRLRL